MAFGAVSQNGDVEVHIDDVFSLKDTLQSGQTFRWKPYNDGFLGIVGENICYVSQNENGVVFHNCDINDYNSIWKNYFSFDTDYQTIRRALEYDPNVKRAMDYCAGIRIMRQPLWETVISFIISANNNIPRIMGIIERLSEKFGECKHSVYGDFYTFPSPESLANAEISDIRSCGTGYRDEYIKRTATAFANGSFSGDNLNKLPRYEARKELMTLYGVGAKVADCILLFSVGCKDAFPIDTWVKKIMCELYAKNEDPRNVSIKKLEKLAERQFPTYAGYAQQVLFHYIRNYTSEEKQSV